MPISYTVKQGDTLNDIASSYGYKNYKDAGVSSVSSGNFDLIRPGEVVNLGNASKTLVEPNVYKVGNVYQDSTGKTINYTPVMQSTTQQDTKDEETSAKIDGLTGTKPNTPNGTPTGTPAGTTTVGADGKPVAPTYKTPDGQSDVSEKPVAGSRAYSTPVTGLEEGEKAGYGADGRRYIIGKDGTTRNDPFADQEYEINRESIERTNKNTAILDAIQLRADEAHSALINSIKTKSAYNRQLMEETNKRYLALKQNEGFSGGQARYMSDINNGILQDNEQKGIERLNAIDVAEQVAIAEATAAKTDKDFERAYKKLNEVDTLQKEKRTAIQDVMKATNEFNKALEEQAKAVADAKKAQTEQGYKTLETAAPTLLAGFDQLKTPELQQTFLVNYAKRLGIKPEEVSGVIEAYRSKKVKADAELQQTYAQTRASDRSNQPKPKTNTNTDTTGNVDDFGGEDIMTPEEQKKVQKKQDFFGKVDKLIAQNAREQDGTPTVSEDNYLTYAAFKNILRVGILAGATREEIITRFKSRLNLSTTFNRAEEYGLTKEEYTKLKKENK